MDKAEIEKLFESIRAWIVAADQKISIALALEIGTIGLIAKPTADLLKSNQATLLKLGLCCLFFAIFLLAYSLTKLLIAIRPRIKPRSASSLLYFGNITALDIKDFKKLVNKRTKKQYQDDLLNQIHINSEICTIKHSNYLDAIYLFILAVVFWVAFVAIILWGRYG